jgi:hypothetical protein
MKAIQVGESYLNIDYIVGVVLHHANGSAYTQITMVNGETYSDLKRTPAQIIQEIKRIVGTEMNFTVSRAAQKN